MIVTNINNININYNIYIQYDMIKFIFKNI